MDENVNQELPTPPARPSAFTLITRSIWQNMWVAALRGTFIYLIWNYCLSQELQMPQLSFAFCACVFLFIQCFFYSPSEAHKIAMLSLIEQHLFEIKNISLFSVTTQLQRRPQTPVVKKDSEKTLDNDSSTL